ncbi:EAL domain-containing protein [Aestuariirhabdus sp. Z084]|uniref:sensor domain-containing protein n=1 Tax=Aestuariirhabdus haliotis TaxID=2918751 RepID=UPI00201B37F8|nr:bifunctional diguanylate cyclase/phosphodiesterase [Aestuariirhabdus haliotis]MCL6414528.1 EAL domain-containing protein [Aestuariirhabdus haliotis]MCL6418490.1 EAL domain-containing protein [Aestuariirhabdus haliotis]
MVHPFIQSLFSRWFSTDFKAFLKEQLFPLLLLASAIFTILLSEGLPPASQALIIACLGGCLIIYRSCSRGYRQQHLFANADENPRILIDGQGHVLQSNAAAKLFLPDTDQLTAIGNCFKEDETRAILELINAARNGQSRIETLPLTIAGSTHQFRITCQPLQEHNLRGNWLLSFCDITELQMLGLALEQTEQHYQQVVDLTTEALLLLDGGIITYANRSAARLLGVDNEEDLIHRELREFITNSQWAKLPKPFHQLLHKKSYQLNDCELELCTQNKTPLFVEAVANPFQFQEHISVLLSLRDIGYQKEQQQQLEHAAHYDDITSLPNRQFFLAQLSRVIARSHRAPTEHAVLFIDLDNFKEINDTLGHQTGDHVLQEIARRLSNHSRRENTLARLGGDEFSLLIENISSPYDASSAASNIVELLSTPIRLHGHTRWVTPSIGIALYPQNGTTTKELLKNADTAMYHAKRAGKNSYRFFSANMNRTLNRRLQLEQELDSALSQGSIQSYFQPRVQAKDNQIIGLEALSRWYNEEGELVTPGEHLPIAEQSQLIFRFEQEVLQLLQDQLRKWRLLGVSYGTLSINLSAALLQDSEELLVQLNRLRLEQTVDNQLEIELDAPILLNESPKLTDVLHKISQLGFKISLDRFGATPTSLPLLSALPIDTIKIDPNLVRDVDSSSESQRILKTISLTAQNLGIQLTATGVETEQQAHQLKKLGCTLMQGYFFHSPQNAETTTHLLLEKQREQTQPFGDR